MPVFTSLPTEVWCQIFSRLPSLDLATCCLVSHRVRSLASSFLYTDVIVSPSTIHLFARTILASEPLSNYVTNLRSTWPLTGSDQWHAVQVSLLLHLLPNLSILDCTPPETYEQDNPELLDIFHERRLCEAPPLDTLPAGLQSVREILNGNDENDEEYADCVPLTVLLAMMLLPRIRKIQAFTIGYDQPHEMDRISATYAGQSPVTHLHLLERYTSLPELQRILQVPRALTHFSYRYICHDMVSIDCAQFGRAIRHLRWTLQSLALDFGEGIQPNDEGVAATRRTIGSLRDWPVLAYVRSSLQPLLGVPNAPDTPRLGDVLPRGIRTFAWDEDWTWETSAVTAAVVELVERKDADGMLQLAMIEVPGRVLPGRDFCGALEDACGAAGVAFRAVASDWVTEVVYSE